MFFRFFLGFFDFSLFFTFFLDITFFFLSGIRYYFLSFFKKWFLVQNKFGRGRESMDIGYWKSKSEVCGVTECELIEMKRMSCGRRNTRHVPRLETPPNDVARFGRISHGPIYCAQGPVPPLKGTSFFSSPPFPSSSPMLTLPALS